MGKSDTTEVIIEAAKVALVASDLLGQLISWVSLVVLDAQRFPGLGATNGETFQQPDDLSKSKAYEHFLQQFSYAYNGEDSLPPLDTGAKISVSENFFNVQANNQGAIGKAVSAQLKDITAPWATAKMIKNESPPESPP
jgi:hypothetical protein